MSGRRQRAKIVRRLRDLLAGEVLADAGSRRKFSHDRSIYEIPPLAVALPADREDLGRLIRFAAAEGLHITPRGGGSGTAGGALGEDIVVVLPARPDWQRIDDFSVSNGLGQVSAGAGIFHNRLQEFLKTRGYLLPADVTSAGISQLGGNIATKASGPHALRYGSIDSFIEHLEFITAQGELIDTAEPATIPVAVTSELNSLARRLLASAGARQLLIDRQEMKTTSGYNMFAFLKGFDDPGKLLARLLAGSNGTLGFITGATLRVVPRAVERAAMLLYFDTLAAAGGAAAVIRDLGATAVEIMDRATVRLVVRKTGRRGSFDDYHTLLVEFEGRECRELIETVGNILARHGLRPARKPVMAASEQEIAGLWDLRRRILPLLNRPGPHLKALAVVNDIGVAPALLANCIIDLQNLFKRQKIEALIYGHAGSGNLHVRPLFDTAGPDLAGRIRRLAEAVYEVVFGYKGTVAGEHGTGRLKAPYLRREWGDELYGWMREVKTILDPQGVFNPQVMFSQASITDYLRQDLQEQRRSGHG